MSLRSTTVVGLLAVAVGTITASGEFEIIRSTIDAGGQTRTNGGSFELSGTVGQHDAGVLNGTSFELSGGLWIQIPPADCNETGWPDLFDFDGYGQCVTGPDQSIVVAECNCFDLDDSGTVDLVDFAEFQIRY